MNISYPRNIYLVRHGERIDNVNRNWTQLHPKNKWDNSPLSERGLAQAEELKNHFTTKKKVDHLFVSPFERTMQTASPLAIQAKLPMKLEPGLIEVLYLCCSPPSFDDPEESSKTYYVDLTYQPLSLPREKHCDDDDCIERVTNCFKQITSRYSGDLLLMSHGAPIRGILMGALNHSDYVGQATITHLIEVAPHKFELKKFAAHDHLSDPRNLRPCLQEKAADSPPRIVLKFGTLTKSNALISKPEALYEIFYE